VMVALPGPDPVVTNFSGVVAQPLVLVTNQPAAGSEAIPIAQPQRNPVLSK
jgi:hypothetical protein